MEDFLSKIREMAESIQKSFKPIIDSTTNLQKSMEPFAKTLAHLFTQLQSNFVVAISSLEPPKTYDSKKVLLHEGIHKTALMYAELIETIEKTPFSFLKERLDSGLAAHLKENYHLSIYEFFSAIDGMLTWFYCKNRDCTKFPDINQKLDLFFDTYKFEKIIGEKIVEPKFKIFFQHRNEIMHGGEHAHFDRNISSIALLFLGIVYYSLTEMN